MMEIWRSEELWGALLGCAWSLHSVFFLLLQEWSMTLHLPSRQQGWADHELESTEALLKPIPVSHSSLAWLLLLQPLAPFLPGPGLPEVTLVGELPAHSQVCFLGWLLLRMFLLWLPPQFCLPVTRLCA